MLFSTMKLRITKTPSWSIPINREEVSFQPIVLAWVKRLFRWARNISKRVKLAKRSRTCRAIRRWLRIRRRKDTHLLSSVLTPRLSIVTWYQQKMELKQLLHIKWRLQRWISFSARWFQLLLFHVTKKELRSWTYLFQLEASSPSYGL